MKLGKGIVVLSALLLFAACRTNKETTTEESTTTNDPVVLDDSERLVGTVVVDKDCGTVIHVIQGDVIRYLSPDNLPEKFAVDGMKLRFTAVPTDAQLLGDCSIYRVVSVSEVTLLR